MHQHAMCQQFTGITERTYSDSTICLESGKFLFWKFWGDLVDFIGDSLR